MATPVLLVTGFEPFAAHDVNPSAELAKVVDGQPAGRGVVHAAVLPVHHAEARRRVADLLAERDPAAVLHLGLASGRARLALERAALNVMDYAIPDNAGYRAGGEPCVPGGPAAYFSTLPVSAILAALTAEGIPAYLSNTAGTYLCNQTLYTTLHDVARSGRQARIGFLHLPLLPSMVAASGQDQPSMALDLMRQALDVALRVMAETILPA